MITVLKEKGIHAVDGGHHQNRPTYNALCHFDLSYIEFISASDKKKLRLMNHPKFSLMESIIKNGFTEGFIRFIVRTHDIQKTAAYFENKGLEVIGPVPLSRVTPDGSVSRWKLLFVGDTNDGPNFPYFIQWDESDNDRIRNLVEKGIIGKHSYRTKFSHITIAVKDLEKTVENWAELFNLQMGGTYIDNKLQAKCRTLFLNGGNIVLSSPMDDGIVSKVLIEHGEKPFKVTLIRDIKKESFELFGGSYQIETQQSIQLLGGT
ncbi:hypothetical protein ABID53_002132 [Bacillus oleivorans]